MTAAFAQCFLSVIKLATPWQQLQHLPYYLALLTMQELQKEAVSVPVDDAQPRCALSGEKFEKFWHDKYQVCLELLNHFDWCDAKWSMATPACKLF